jgi:hypothetical protein
MFSVYWFNEEKPPITRRVLPVRLDRELFTQNGVKWGVAKRVGKNLPSYREH